MIRVISIGFSKKWLVALYLGIACVVLGTTEILEKWMPIPGEVTLRATFMEGGWMALAIVAGILLHEVFHFLAFRMCGVRPRFLFVKVKGFGWCPSVSSGGGWVTRRNLVLAALAPQLLTLVGICVAFIAPVEVGRVLLLASLANCMGGIGDYQMVIKASRLPNGSQFMDEGGEIKAYVPISKIEAGYPSKPS